MAELRRAERGLVGNPFAEESALRLPNTEKITQLISQIEESASTLPRADLKALASRIFEHSAEDGLKLTERLNLTPDELFDMTCGNPNFAVKHARVFEAIQETVKSLKSRIPKAKLETIEKAPGLWRGEEKHAAIKLEHLSSRKLFAQIDDMYSDLLKHRRIKERPSTHSNKSQGERLAEVYLAEAEMALEGSYYGAPVRKELESRFQDKTSKKLEKWIDHILERQLVTESEIDALCMELNIEPSDFKKSLKSAKYNLYGPVHGVHKTAAESSLKSEIRKGIKEGQELVLEDGRYQVKESTPVPGWEILERKEYGRNSPICVYDGKFLHSDLEAGRWVLKDEDGNNVFNRPVSEPKVVDGKLYAFAENDFSYFSLVSPEGEEFRTLHENCPKNITKAQGKIMFTAREKGVNYICDNQGGVKASPYRVIDNLVGSEKGYFYTAGKNNLHEVILDQDGNEYGRGENPHDPVVADGTLYYVFGDGGNQGIKDQYGKIFAENRFITHIIAIGNKVYFADQGNGKAKIYDLEGNVYGDELDFVYSLFQDGGKLYIYGKRDGKKEKTVISFGEQADKKEFSSEFENKALDIVESLLIEGENSQGEESAKLLRTVADAISGMDSERAWKIRNKFFKAENRRGLMLLSLVGLDTTQVWGYRRLYAAKYGITDDLLDSLAGLDTSDAWKMREGAQKKSENMESVRGLDSDQAWDFREKMAEDKDWHIISYIEGLDSPRAWKIRREILADENREAIWGEVIRSLAGIDTDEAWKIRNETPLFDGDPFYVLKSLEGLDSDRAHEAREVFFSRGDERTLSLLAESLVGLDSERVWRMRERIFKSSGNDKVLYAETLSNPYRVFTRKDEGVQVPTKTKERLDLLNLVHNPEVKGIGEYFERTADDKKGLLESSVGVVKILNQMVAQAPEIFMETLGSRRDRSPELLANKLVTKIFYEAISEKRGEKKDYLDLLREYLPGVKAAKTDMEPGLMDHADHQFDGGGAEDMADKKEVMDVGPLRGFMATGIYGKYDQSTRSWTKGEFSLYPAGIEPLKEATVVIQSVAPGCDLVLPKPFDASLIPERVQGIKADGSRVDLKVEMNTLGEAIIRNLPKVAKVAYSLRYALSPEPMLDVSEKDYERFRARFERKVNEVLTQKLALLPEEVDAFLSSKEYLALAPRERVAAIENYVRSLGFYDLNNQETEPLKRGKNIEERMILQEMRLEELRAKHPELALELQGKRFAGVCVDFMEITCAILRRAGFVAGVSRGFAADDRSVQARHAHAVAFVVWPNSEGGNRAVIVDGTPSNQDTIALGIATPSLQEREKASEQSLEAALEENKLQLDSMMRTIESGNADAIRKLDNGKLENVLNFILAHEVKDDHADMLSDVLDLYWYGGLSRMDRVTQGVEIAKTMEQFVMQRRTAKESRKKEGKKPGSRLFESVEEFVRKYQKENKAEAGEALDFLDNIFGYAKGSLAEVESKAFVSIVTYLRGKNMAGKRAK